MNRGLLRKYPTALTTFLSLNAFAAETTLNVNYKSTMEFDAIGTCYLTITAYGSDGSTYTWTEEYWAYSNQNCQDLANFRLEQLNGQN
ncbi:hypothetical protein QGN23_12695 [Chryseobacterium gotjawalense]|uniref:Uncharacterized protein n=1 Tax=Chryseobacterium gotjawalense TaxID=3042315 RepID=A0ABY8RBE0_9FLAO|nr:hypothetical protein [Chryseobacterium sp. wdc7]WHF51280.1 hypothetical protein QGN23_12695 [Chryseobacterium sp. wdc7]